MLLKNTDVTRGLANGARGVVIGFEPPEEGEGFQGWGALPKVAFKVATNSNENTSHGVGAGGNRGGSGKSSSDYRTVTAIIEPAEWSLELGRARVASRMQVSKIEDSKPCFKIEFIVVSITSFSVHFSECMALTNVDLSPPYACHHNNRCPCGVRGRFPFTSLKG